MSIKVMNRVWEHSTVGGSELLILLAIADHAHDDGGGAWPSLKTLSRKSKLSSRQVSRIILSLEKQGELGIQRRAGPHGTNMYTVLSGFQRDTSIRRCYMCDAIESDVQIDEHHTIPGDDCSIVLLCAPCHTKIHSLQRKGGDDKMSHAIHDIEHETSDSEKETQQRPTNHDLDPSFNRQEEPASQDSPPADVPQSALIGSEALHHEGQGFLVLEWPSEVAAIGEEPPAEDDDSEPFYLEGETPTQPAVPRTAEQVKAGVQRAIETFHQTGGRPGVADPSQDDEWMGPAREFSALIVTPDVPDSRLRIWADDIRAIVDDSETDKGATEVSALIRSIALCKDYEWLRACNRPTHKGFVNALLAALWGQTLPEGKGGSSTPRNAPSSDPELEAAYDRIFDENGRRRPEYA